MRRSCPSDCKRDTRQLSAPKSMATIFGSGLPGMEEIRLAQEGFGKAAVDGNEMAGGTGRFRPGEEENGFGADPRIDRLMRQRALGIEGRQRTAQLIIGH